jgi:hypothetical protein
MGAMMDTGHGFGFLLAQVSRAGFVGRQQLD